MNPVRLGTQPRRERARVGRVGYMGDRRLTLFVPLSGDLTSDSRNSILADVFRPCPSSAFSHRKERALTRLAEGDRVLGPLVLSFAASQLATTKPLIGSREPPAPLPSHR